MLSRTEAAAYPSGGGQFLQELFPPESRHLVWFVGGAVRDMVLRKEVRDFDLVAALPVGELERLGFRRVKGVTTGPIWLRSFKEFGNVEVTVVADRAAVLADLTRRDFTVNAILMSLDGKMDDPLGGTTDLAAMVLRSCSSRAFQDDPLRIFRAFRFEAEGFRLSAETAGLIRAQEWEEHLRRIPVERFSREMVKALAGAYPARFFQRMTEFQVGREYLPELFQMTAIPAGPLKYHPEGDLLTHSLQVLERTSPSVAAALGRFCAFFHDIGKLSTDPTLFPKHHGHDEAGFRVAADFCRRLALPGEYGRSLAWISRLHGNANRLAELKPSTRIRMATKALANGIEELLPVVSAADKPDSSVCDGWTEAVVVAGMNMEQLGVKIEMLALMQPAKRAEYILQKRVECLKGFLPAVSVC